MELHRPGRLLEGNRKHFACRAFPKMQNAKDISLKQEEAECPKKKQEGCFHALPVFHTTDHQNNRYRNDEEARIVAHQAAQQDRRAVF